MVYQLTRSVQTYAEMLTACYAFMEGASESEIKAAADKFYGIAPDALRTILEDRLLDGFDLTRVFSQLSTMFRNNGV
jgi:hypothetical protein